ncbi:receptor-like protein 9DC3 [Pistacia vera]|uniref:receptor-like protein 9DC3 n=1 Tax=Pistacia vera TaxID=55513 RepID=UPI001263DEC6|nr:receptor-like protein 9DC3 [Pistacia vera]
MMMSKADEDCCSWDGVTCNEVTGHVIALNLTSSCLYGSINSSSSLFQLVHLECLSYLDLYGSGFSGKIPSEILELSKLETLDASFNVNLELQKPGLKSLVEKLTHLKVLFLDKVNISSSVLDILANLSSLTALSLRECELQGEFPAKIFQLPNLHVLSVRYNPSLSGYLPEFEMNSPLEDLRLAGTGFSGKIPYSIRNLGSLLLLDISNCSFSRSIPSSLGNLTKITYLYLNGNEFSGELPIVIGNLSSLEELHPSYNSFSSQDSGSLSWMANASPLAYLQTVGLGQVSLITYDDERIDLLPVSYSYSLQTSTKGVELEYGKISNLLTAIIFSSNKFEGEIPTSIGKLKGLQFLVLSNNNLKGPIPPSIANLTTMESLDLSNNNLSGLIPQQLQDLTFLSHFNVPNNHLRGPIPQGKQFDTFKNNSFEGNPGLCGKQIGKKCEKFRPSKNEENPAGSKFPFEFGWKVVLMGYASGLVIGVAFDHAFSPRKEERFMKIFRKKPMKAIGRNRAHRNRT